MRSSIVPLLRNSSLLLAALVAVANPLRAQGDVAGGTIAAAAGLAYLGLTVASIVRATEGSEAATLGSTVRVAIVNASGRSQLRGQLTAADADSLTIVVDSVPRRVARADIRDMSAFKGTERKWAQGYGIGLASGAVVGALGGLSSGDDPASEWFSFTAKEKGVILGVAGGIFGSAVGGLIGLAVEGEHWKSIDRLPAGTTAIVRPTREGGYAVGVRIPF